MRFILVPLISAALVTTTLAQNPQFVLSSRDRANLLAVDFVATDRDGALITDLAPHEITVRLGGRTRPTLALEFVRTGSGPERTADHPLPFGDNAEHRSPRSLILMVDQDTIRPGRTVQVRDAVRLLLAGLGSDDRVALVTVPFGGLAVDLTRDRTRITDGMANLSAQGARIESAEDAQCRTLTTLQAMTDTLQRLSLVEEPVTVVFFSSQQAGPQQTIRMTGRGAVGGPCDLRAATFTDLGRAAARARAQFFVVHSDIDQRGSGLDGLEHLTGVTGGPLLYLSTGDGRSAMARVLAETSGHYIARVTRDPSDVADDDLGVSVSTSRQGVTIRRAPRFVVSRPAMTTTPAPTSLADLLRQGRLARDLPLRVTAHTFRDDAPGHVRLAITLESPDRTAVLSRAMIGVFDTRGELIAGLDLASDALIRQPAMAAVSVPEGAYLLRAAADASGRIGSAEQAIDASLTRIGPFHASGVMVGLSREGGFVPMMVFGDEPTAFGLLDLYGAVQVPPRVVFEIATTTNSPALVTMPGLVEQTPVPTRAIVSAVLPIAGLPPGDYVVRVTITPEGQPAGRVVRALRKTLAHPLKESAD